LGESTAVGLYFGYTMLIKYLSFRLHREYRLFIAPSIRNIAFVEYPISFAVDGHLH